MSDAETARQRQRVLAWTLAEPAMEEIRRERLRGLNMAQAIGVLPSLATARSLGLLSRPLTGLIEQQAIFARWYHGRPAGRST